MWSIFTDCLKLKYVRKNLMYVIVQQIKRYLLNLFIFYWREEGIIQTQLDHSIKVKILTIWYQYIFPRLLRWASFNMVGLNFRNKYPWIYDIIGVQQDYICTYSHIM